MYKMTIRAIGSLMLDGVMRSRENKSIGLKTAIILPDFDHAAAFYSHFTHSQARLYGNARRVGEYLHSPILIECKPSYGGVRSSIADEYRIYSEKKILRNSADIWWIETRCTEIFMYDELYSQFMAYADTRDTFEEGYLRDFYKWLKKPRVAKSTLLDQFFSEYEVI